MPRAYVCRVGRLTKYGYAGMESGLQPSKDERRQKSPLTKTTSLTAAGVKPKHHRSAAGCSPTSKSAGVGGSAGLSALMLREMEDLRSLSIGSPVPTPRTDDDDDAVFAAAFADESFPEIRIDRCSRTVGAANLEDRASRRAEDCSRNGRPRDEAAATTGVVGPSRSSTKPGQRSD